MNIQNNPWRGLLSYADPDKSQSTYQFCGRDSAVGSIFAMIDNNLLVTMYGKTGIGKTSVLNAGVFPLLRSRRYLPVSIRLGKYISEEEISFAACIVQELKAEIKDCGGRIETKFPNYDIDNCMGVEFLWRYFLTHTFFNSAGEEIYPVLALDQFEEIFIGNARNATLLLKQIYALLDDNREVPDTEGYSDYTNFRIIFSIREDDLFYLEDAIDINHLIEMKQNRYRLCPLTEQDAREVVYIGKEYIENGAEEEIAVRIINLSKDENGHISTNILSLVCSQLFIQSQGVLSVQALDTFSQNPLESFYEDCMAHVQPRTRKFIEEHLTDQDRRKFISKKELKENVSQEDINTLSSGEYRILQKITAGNSECVELIHDSIAKTIYHLNNDNSDFQKYKELLHHNRLIRYGIYILLVILAIAVGVIVFQFYENREIEALDRNGNFAINIVEDSIVVADNDYWEGNLVVIGKSSTKTDTLKQLRLNKSNKGDQIDFQANSVNSVQIIMTFKDGKYANVDTTLSMVDLKKRPSINIPVRKILPHMYKYSSQVVVDIDGQEINVQDAIIILHDKIQRSDNDGKFTFLLEDSIKPSDMIYIVRKDFRCVEENNLVVNGIFKEKFVIAPADSTSQFEITCSSLDSIKPTEWRYSTVTPKKANGVLVNYSDGNVDRLILRAKINGQNAEGKYLINGYYYYISDYLKMSAKAHPHYAYHLLTGWMDMADPRNRNAKSRSFDIDAYDAFGNKQHIKGILLKSGKLQGLIFCNDLQIATFGGIKTATH